MSGRSPSGAFYTSSLGSEDGQIREVYVAAGRLEGRLDIIIWSKAATVWFPFSIFGMCTVIQYVLPTFP